MNPKAWKFEASQSIACTGQSPAKYRHLYSVELKRAVREKQLTVHVVNRHFRLFDLSRFLLA